VPGDDSTERILGRREARSGNPASKATDCKNSTIRDARNGYNGGQDVVERMCRRPLKGEDLGLFDTALKLVEDISNARNVHDPSTRCVKSKQLGIKKLQVPRKARSLLSTDSR
jgi:hypothetical protein